MPIKVEPSGVMMTGKCSVQTEKCIARSTAGRITAAWGPLPARGQIDVCGPCLRDMVRRREWTVATLPPPQLPSQAPGPRRWPLTGGGTGQPVR